MLTCVISSFMNFISIFSLYTYVRYWFFFQNIFVYYIQKISNISPLKSTKKVVWKNLVSNTIKIIIYLVFNFEKFSIYVNWSFLINLFLNLAKMLQVRAHYACIMWKCGIKKLLYISVNPFEINYFFKLCLSMTQFHSMLIYILQIKFSKTETSMHLSTFRS